MTESAPLADGSALSFGARPGRAIGDLTIMEGAEWVAPWGQVIAMLVLVTVAVTVSTVIPARSAGRIRPAVALRIAE